MSVVYMINSQSVNVGEKNVQILFNYLKPNLNENSSEFH